MKELTQHQKILAIMLRNPKQEWWHGEELMSLGEFFVGYEASARLTELCGNYPFMFERRKSPKGNRQLQTRIRFEDMAEILLKVPPPQRRFIKEQLEKAKVPYQRYEMQYVKVER